MHRARRSAAALAALRVAYAAALVASPTRTTQRWLGPGARSDAATVALRGLGARDGLLHLGALAGVCRGGPVRSWLVASIAGDLADIAATVASRRGLPPGSARATVAVAGASGLLTTLVIVALDE